MSGYKKTDSGLNARAIDFAKFGALFLNHGNWNGKQIIPERWVGESTSPDPNDHRPWRVAADWKVVIVRCGLVEGGADWWPDVFRSVIDRVK